MRWSFFVAFLMLSALACNAQYTVGKLIDYHLVKPWNESVWISAKDAQVVTGKVVDGTRAADGASWFMSSVCNAKKVKRAVWKTTALGTMQTPALFALKNNLLQGSAKDAMIARLRQNFEQHDNCLQTGFLGTSILMQTLTENGMQDIAYELLFQHKNPSWLYSVDNGATTIWERWNSYTVDKGMGPRGMNSFNHYAYGCVCQWLWETAAGIAADPQQPGFKHIIMKPVPDKRLGHLKAEYKSAAGTIKSEWHYKGSRWTWTFTVPKGATATVTLPGETTSKEYKAGTYTIKRGGIAI